MIRRSDFAEVRRPAPEKGKTRVDFQSLEDGLENVVDGLDEGEGQKLLDFMLQLDGVLEILKKNASAAQDQMVEVLDGMKPQKPGGLDLKEAKILSERIGAIEQLKGAVKALSTAGIESPQAKTRATADLERAYSEFTLRLEQTPKLEEEEEGEEGEVINLEEVREAKKSLVDLEIKVMGAFNRLASNDETVRRQAREEIKTNIASWRENLNSFKDNLFSDDDKKIVSKLQKKVNESMEGFVKDDAIEDIKMEIDGM